MALLTGVYLQHGYWWASWKAVLRCVPFSLFLIFDNLIILMELGFEVRVSCLQSRYSTT
jgi:hypothetical protein